jgi:hypothetical protein
MQKKSPLLNIINFIHMRLDKLDLRHLSATGSSNKFSNFNGLGISFIRLISCQLAISVDGVDEKSLSLFSRTIKLGITELLLNEFSNSNIYQQIIFGAGVTANDKKSHIVQGLIFHNLLGQLLALGHFYEIHGLFINLQMKLATDDTKDYRTLLQEIGAKKGEMPQFEDKGSDGVLHSLQFTVSATLFGMTAIATKNSKKQARKEASKLLIYKIRPAELESSIMLKGIDLTFYKRGLGKLKIGYSEKIGKTFNIPDSIDLTPALIHPRIKNNDYWSRKSHRTLATLGAAALDFFTRFNLILIIEKSSLDIQVGAISSLVIKNSALVKVFQYGVVVLPDSDHLELNLEGFKVDSIQSLFAISFLSSIEFGDMSVIRSSYFMQWIDKRIAFSLEASKFPVKKTIQQIALERIQRLGFVFEYQSNEGDISALITSIKTGNQFEFSESNRSDTVKDQKSHVIRSMLKFIDGYECVSLTNDIEEGCFLKYKDFYSFIHLELINSRKLKCVEMGLHLTPLNAELQNRYINESFESLIELWRESLFSLEDRAEILFRLRSFLGLSGPLSEVSNYCWEPIIFDCFFENNEEQSVIGFDNDMYRIDEDDIVEEPVSSGASLKPPASEDAAFEALDVESDVLGITRARDGMLEIKRKVELLDLVGLERLWENREVVFEYIEEAAIVLAELRYKKGIDFHLSPYTSFISTKIICELDLPSLDNEKTIKAKNPVVVNSQKTSKTPESKNELENLNLEDDRKVELRKTKIRTGQQKFRAKMINRWSSCALSGSNVSAILEAAHIAPYRGVKDNHTSNGLLLRVDLHRLFDKYLIGIEPDNLKVHISDKLIHSEYAVYQDKILASDGNDLSEPALVYRWHLFTEKNTV